MTILVKLVADYALWLYLTLVLVALLFVRAYLVARRDKENAIFTLERETAGGRMGQALMGLLVALVLVGGVMYTSQVLVEEVPLPQVTPTATVLVVLPPSPTPPPLLPTPTTTATPLPRPTLAPLATDTPPPPPPAAVPADCPNPAVRISEPADAVQVSGVINIIGSANIDDFGYYKFEFRGTEYGDWTFIQSFDQPINGGILGAWDTRSVPSGDYEFRLVVVDSTGNYPAPCAVKLTVVN